MEFDIRPAVSEPLEPKLAAMYEDADGDLFMWLGDEWLEISRNGTHRRLGNYPVEPLQELSADQIENRLDDKLGGY